MSFLSYNLCYEGKLARKGAFMVSTPVPNIDPLLSEEVILRIE